MKLPLILLFFLTTPVFAIGLEIMGGYSKGNFENDSNSGELSGPTLAAKIGTSGKNLPFSVGGEVSWSNLNFKPEDGGEEKDYQRLELGPYAGLVLPDIPFIPKRIWASYLLFNQLRNSDQTFKGSGYRLGIGDSIPILPVMVNAVYTSHKYDSLEGTGNENALPINAESYAIYVSFPFEL
ncbi:MAG: hypothetical protein ACLGHN_08465 [Bacteriovoracia bacterium]